MQNPTIAQTPSTCSEGRNVAPYLVPSGAKRSLLTYAPELLLVIVATIGASRWTDPDLWGHIHFGQEMMSRLGVMRYDPYSYTALGHLWLNPEWLSEVIMAVIYNTFGVIGLKLWKFACAAALIALLALDLAETGAPRRLQLCTLTVAVVGIAPRMQIRPQLCTFVLFAAMLALLARDNYRGRAPLWLAIPLMALWANLHGGFIVGVLALDIYAGATAFGDFVAQRPMDRLPGSPWWLPRVRQRPF